MNHHVGVKQEGAVNQSARVSPVPACPLLLLEYQVSLNHCSGRVHQPALPLRQVFWHVQQACPAFSRPNWYEAAAAAPFNPKLPAGCSEQLVCLPARWHQLLSKQFKLENQSTGSPSRPGFHM